MAATWAALVCLAFLVQDPEPRPTTFWNVAVVDLDSGSVLTGMAVGIANRRITRVEKATGSAPAGITIVDGRGKFLIPGLWDSHVHLTKLGEPALPLFLANGVTSVRDMGSDIIEVEHWRAQMASGVRPGPRIKTSGRILESRTNVERMKREKTVEPVDRIRMPVGSPDEAREAVSSLAAAGADFLKIRTVASQETLAAIVEAARERKLKLTGHPLASVDAIIDARLASVEHALAIPPLDLPPGKRRALFERMRDAGVWMGTTTVNLENSVFLSYEAAQARLMKDPRRRYVGKYLASDWAEQLAEKRPADAARQMKAFAGMAPLFFRDLHEMHAAGVTFLAGSDAAVLLVYPGFSLHGELESLVRNVGLTPVQALRAATRNPAAFFGMERELGSIAPGYLADLVLLDANPLEDIRRTERISGVMQDGRWLDRKALDELLERAARDARK